MDVSDGICSVCWHVTLIKSHVIRSLALSLAHSKRPISSSLSLSSSLYPALFCSVVSFHVTSGKSKQHSADGWHPLDALKTWHQQIPCTQFSHISTLGNAFLLPFNICFRLFGQTAPKERTRKKKTKKKRKMKNQQKFQNPKQHLNEMPLHMEKINKYGQILLQHIVTHTNSFSVYLTIRPSRFAPKWKLPNALFLFICQDFSIFNLSFTLCWNCNSNTNKIYYILFEVANECLFSRHSEM